MAGRVARVAAAARAWRLRRLLDAPHRLAFAAAVSTLSLASAWWAVVNVSAGAGTPLRWGLPPVVAHGVLMTFGFMPMFFAGFVFTAGPKWLALPAVPARALVASILAQSSGWVLFALALHGGDALLCRGLAAAGVGCAALGWADATARLAGMLRRSRVADRTHLGLVALAGALGVGGLGLAAFGLGAGDPALVLGAVRASSWWFIGLTFAAMAHRMIPFFSGAGVPALDARSPTWSLRALAALFAIEGAAAWLDAPPWQQAHGAVELLAGAGVLELARRAAASRALRQRLVAMLFIGFAWLGVALVLAGIARLAGGHALRIAAMHAYTMGFLGSTLFAMVGRVSSAHAGRAVAADDFVWRLHALLQLAIVMRVAAGLVADASGTWAARLVAAAAVAWAVAWLAWSGRYLMWYGSPRADGRVG